jgi:hypothetical protein
MDLWIFQEYLLKQITFPPIANQMKRVSCCKTALVAFFPPGTRDTLEQPLKNER